MAPTRRTLRRTAGLIVGGAAGAAVLGGIGVLALDHASGLLWGLAFFVSFVGLLFGIVAPLALVRYLGDREGSRVARQLSTAGGYAAIVVVTVGVAAVGLVFAPAGVTDDPQVVLVAFDLLAGAVFGAILGLHAAEGRL